MGYAYFWTTRKVQALQHQAKMRAEAAADDTELAKFSLSSVMHTALDYAGMVPGIGEVFDVVNAGLYLAEGNPVMAGLSSPRPRWAWA